MRKLWSALQQTHYLFLGLALIAGLIFVVAVPPLWGTDETSHFARTYQIAHGQLIPDRNSTTNFGGYIPSNLYQLEKYTKGDLLDNKGLGLLSRKDVDSVGGYAKFTSQHFSKQQEVNPDSAPYSPVAYAGSVIGVVAADIFNAPIGTTITLARLGGLFLYVAIVWFALKLLKNSKVKWALFAIALLPTPLFQAAVVTTDNLVNGLSLLFVALLYRLLKSKGPLNPKLFGTLVAVGILLPLVKINYIFLSFALVLIPYDKFRTRWRAVVVKASSVVAAIIPGVIWLLLSNPVSQSSGSTRPDGLKVVVANQVSSVVHSPLHFVFIVLRSIIEQSDIYLKDMISIIGWNYVTIPLIVIIVLCGAVFIAGVVAKKELVGIRKQLMILNVFALVGIVSIFGSLYIAFNTPASRIVDGVQGRYFVPFILPLILLIASYAPFEISMKDKVKPYVFGTISALGLFGSIIFYMLVTY